MKIAVAMSGGVDSSVAAALMVEKYGQDDVFGVTAKLFCYSKGVKEKACCSLEAIDDARAVCNKLGIPHYVINAEKEFRLSVINSFISAYQHGQTPIPCIACNTLIKFGSMLDKVKELGAEKLVTGHYARIKETNGKFQLLRGIDTVKDQTYFLYGLSQKQLSYIEFPLGGLEKSEVRKIAKQYGLRVAEKKESQGVCFVTEGTVADFIKKEITVSPGNIVNTKGEIVGHHEGYIFYTIGQRKKIGGGYREPMFVVAIDPLKNEIVIGNKDELYGKKLKYIAGHFIPGKEPRWPLKCTAKIRYNSDDVDCEVTKIKSEYGKHYSASFNKPQRAITPGQSIVLYQEDIVLGGGIIEKAD